MFAASIDYAGMFPPARLSLDQAVRNYVRYLQDPDAWLIGRFVCPASGLDAFMSLADVLRDVPAWSVDRSTTRHRVAVVAAACEEADELLDLLGRDMANIVQFHKQHGDYAEVESMELRMPAVGGGRQPIVSLLKSIRQTIDMGDVPSVRVMIELRPPADRPQVAALLDAMESLGDPSLGLKIRTGGLPRNQLPSVDDFAFFIRACRLAGRRWKATAGLHQPFSNFDSAENGWRFGFFNVLAAAVSAGTGRIGEQQIREILIQTSYDPFTLSDSTYCWKDLRLTVEEVREGRARSITSFGSCSFEEPRDALRRATLIV